MFDRLRLKLEQRLVKLTGATTEQPADLVSIGPAEIEILRLKGNQHLASGALDEAESCFRSALAHAPDSMPLLVCLGYVLKELERLAEARVALRRAAYRTSQHPDVYEAFYLLGQISEQQADWEDALRQFTAALEHKPDFLPACIAGLRMLMALDKKSEVPAFLEERIRQCPSEREYRMIAGRFYVDVSNSQGVIDQFEAAIALGAPLADINMHMGQALLRSYREEESRPFLENALIADPGLAPYIDVVKAGYFGTIGEEETCIALLEKSIAALPDYALAHHALLMVLSFSNLSAQNKDYVAAAMRFARTLESGAQPTFPPYEGAIELSQTRPLRVGFVAGEFKHHPVLHFLLGVLENLDTSRIRTVAFSNNSYDDSGTEAFRAVFDEWVDIRDVDDNIAAELVRSHNIDVLLDLCGHSGDARLGVFAKRPAPVQAAWLGYWASTGLSTMDYIIADPISVPGDSTEWFSEKVYRLPSTRLCMTAPRTAQPIFVTPPPCERNGYITFGSFQRTAKLKMEVLMLWERVLREVPQARLRIQANTGTDSLREHLAQRIRDAGIDMSRVDLIPQTSADLYMAAHSEVDIILDTFPYTGGTTTAQALWMGVPTVTLSGGTMLALQGASMLTCVGLTDWIAKDEDDYLRIARHFANDAQHLAQLRIELRDRALKSPLFDVKRFAHDFTNGLWDICGKSTLAVNAF